MTTLSLHTMPLVQRSLASELRAVLMVARKEWTIFIRYPSWVLSLLIWPVLLPVGYIFTARALSGPNNSSLSSFASSAGTTDYTSFIIVGSLIWGWLNLTLWDVGFQLRNEQMRGTLESNWLCPVWRISIMVGASLTKLITSLCFMGVSLLEFWLLFNVQVVHGNWNLLLLIVVLLIPCIYGIGLIFASVVIRFKEANAFVFLVRGVFMIFCGITYPLDVLPVWMRQVATLLPLTYAIQDVRKVGLAGATFSDIQDDLLKLASFAVLLPVLGYLAFSLTERQARRTGSLGQY